MIDNDEFNVEDIGAENYFSQEELMKIEQDAKIKQSASEYFRLFKELFNYYSINNGVLCDILMHIFLSLICVANNITIHKFNHNKILPALHCYVVQDSGSGKDEAMDFFLDIMNLYNKKIIEHNQKYNTNFKTISHYELSGSETPEAMLDGYEHKNGEYRLFDKDGLPLNPVKGIVSKSNLMISRECSFLFQGTTGGKQSKREELLVLLEGRPFWRSLDSWKRIGKTGIEHPGRTKTIFNGVFIGMTRPVSDMKAHLAYSGLQQRGLNVCRKITEADRKIMDAKVGELWQKPVEFWTDVGIKKNRLTTELVRLTEKVVNQAPVVYSPDKKEIERLITSNLHYVRNSIERDFKSEEHQKILHSFASRFINQLDIIAFENAIIAGDKTTGLGEYQCAMELIWKTFNYIRDWIEENVEEDYRKERKREKEEAVLYLIFKGREEMPYQELKEKLMKKLLISKWSAYRKVNKFVQQKVIIEIGSNSGDRVYKLNC